MRPSRMPFALVALLVALVAAVLAPTATADVGDRATVADVRRGLEGLVDARGGPPGAIATLYRDGRLTVVRAGRADVRRRGAPRARQRMRVASVSKAFSGAVVLGLVRAGRLRLDDTIGQRLTGMPAGWSRVTVRRMLDHTSGLPDYTRSDAFVEQATTNPRGFVAPAEIIDWVRDEPLAFKPGSRYAYSNTDNIVLALIAEAVTGRSYADLLEDEVFGPAKLRRTSFAPRRLGLPAPFMRGYDVEPGERPQDVTTFLSPSGAWASGGVVSTPAELNAFIRAYLGRTFFGRAEQRRQLRFLRRGASSPPGPGLNAPGLAVFRYRTRCGTVYGHTGTFPGYTQFAAATADGRRAVTTTLNSSAPAGELLRRLRAVQATAVCALLR